MIKKIFLTVLFVLTAITPQGFSYDTAFSGNYTIPETQAGYAENQYEVKSVHKLKRGIENTFLSPLEVFHGVKKQYAKRRAEYLPAGMDAFFIGAFRGVGNGFKRFGVGVYEMFTFVYPQEPIVEEYDDWLY